MTKKLFSQRKQKKIFFLLTKIAPSVPMPKDQFCLAVYKSIFCWILRPYGKFKLLFVSPFQFIITQILSFLICIIGTAVLLEHATYGSRIQPIIHHTMMRLIMTSEYPRSADTLKMIQEGVSSTLGVAVIRFLTNFPPNFRLAAAVQKDRTTICCSGSRCRWPAVTPSRATPTSTGASTSWPGTWRISRFGRPPWPWHWPASMSSARYWAWSWYRRWSARRRSCTVAKDRRRAALAT